MKTVKARRMLKKDSISFPSSWLSIRLWPLLWVVVVFGVVLLICIEL